MNLDHPAGLPGRSVLLERLAAMIDSGDAPGVFVISIDGFDTLAGMPSTHDGGGGAASDAGSHAMTELAGRLSRLVRSNDVLAVLGPGLFALGGAGIEHMDTDVVLERLRGVFAMPVDVDGVLVSLPVTVGISHADAAATAGELVDLAERDLQEKLGG